MYVCCLKCDCLCIMGQVVNRQFCALLQQSSNNHCPKKSILSEMTISIIPFILTWCSCGALLVVFIINFEICHYAFSLYINSQNDLENIRIIV